MEHGQQPAENGCDIPLEALRQLPPERWQPQWVVPLLQRAIESRLQLPHSEERDLRVLLVQSIRRQDPTAERLSSGEILHRVQRYDCHQIPAALERKVALFLYIEQALQLPLRAEETVKITTTDQLARHLIARYEEKRRSGS